jgi:hypothetical protein
VRGPLPEHPPIFDLCGAMRSTRSFRPRWPAARRGRWRSRLHRAFDIRATDESGGDCTSRQHNDHITETRELRYRWHCWYGRPVYIFGAFARVGQPAYRCALEADADRLLEIPQWMFDAGACCGMVRVEKASVSIEALFDLKCLLLRAVEVADQSGVLQDEHPKIPETGGAHAKPKGSKGVRSVDIFPSVAANTTVARPAARSTRRNAKSACPTASNTSPRPTRRKGGVR